MTLLINSALQNQIVSTFANGMDLINLLNKLNDSTVKNPMAADLDANGQDLDNVGTVFAGQYLGTSGGGVFAPNGISSGGAQLNPDGSAIFTAANQFNSDGSISFASGNFTIATDGTLTIASSGIINAIRLHSNDAQPCSFDGVPDITTSTLSGPTKTAIEALCAAFGIATA